MIPPRDKGWVFLPSIAVAHEREGFGIQRHGNCRVHRYDGCVGEQ